MTSQNSVGGWGDDIQRTEIGAKFADALIKDYLKGHSNTLNPKIQESNISIELLKKYISNVPVPQNISNVNNHFTENNIRQYLDSNTIKKQNANATEAKKEANRIAQEEAKERKNQLNANAKKKKQENINKEIKILEAEFVARSAGYNNSARIEANKLIKNFKNPGMFSKKMTLNNALKKLKNIENNRNIRRVKSTNSNLGIFIRNLGFSDDLRQYIRKRLPTGNKIKNIEDEKSKAKKIRELFREIREIPSSYIISYLEGKKLSIDDILNTNKDTFKNTIKEKYNFDAEIFKKINKINGFIPTVQERVLGQKSSTVKYLSEERVKVKQNYIKSKNKKNEKSSNSNSSNSNSSNSNSSNSNSSNSKNNTPGSGASAAPARKTKEDNNVRKTKEDNNDRKAKEAQEAERKVRQEKKIQNNRKQLRNMIEKANIGSKNKNRFLAMSKNSKISNTEIRKVLNKKVANVKFFKNSKEAQEKRKQRAEVKSSNENANKATELFSQMTQEPKKAVNRLTEGEKKNMQKQLNMAKPKERGLTKLGKKKLNARGVIEGRTNLNKNTINRYMKQVNNAKQAYVISGILKKLEKEKKKDDPPKNTKRSQGSSKATVASATVAAASAATPATATNVEKRNGKEEDNKIKKPIISNTVNKAIKKSVKNAVVATSLGAVPIGKGVKQQKPPSRWGRMGKTVTAGLALTSGQKPSKPGTSTELAIPGTQIAAAEKPTGRKNTPKINSAPISKINNGKISPFSTGNTGVTTSNLSKKFTFSTNKNTKPFMIKINKKVQKYVNQGKKPESIFRLVAKEVHPNKGGTKEEMQYLQKIKKQMLEGVGEAMTPKKFLPKTNNKSPDVISKALGEAMAPKKQNKNLTKVLNKLSNKAPERKGLIEKTINSAKKSTNIIKKKKLEN
jgi:hypothetical protein